MLQVGSRSDKKSNGSGSGSPKINRSNRIRIGIKIKILIPGINQLDSLYQLCNPIRLPVSIV